VPQASAEQRMKLARAFLDIGDDHLREAAAARTAG
jgi:hypothetical protein